LSGDGWLGGLPIDLTPAGYDTSAGYDDDATRLSGL
jgi:hypothetical protein